ncbi:MAG: winged helix-turn-helix transcriptional regulator [Nanoarchaeota archaeon]|nr:winged helix-turn-helix transcriptional regulator [Nanoarchaeota archaeon]MBU1322137.1 winged helix-turn-helix transcriptional regulator [Nanoarchaeota archaeon]MBU1597605.1 winged helix-turn-helix transcriptional regulator [Nanoarchaeota archaeon]MBU2442097.1 winged helix-turn-helix transcriptional regulator [Nanoarchaeota archaeon]
MKKIEEVFREILYQAIEKNNHVLKQSELSKKLGFSLSTINLAVKKLERMNAVKIEKMNFKVIDIKKILYLWASIRNIEKDIIYKTRAELAVREIEKNLPNIEYAAYTAYKFKFKDVPADYSEVYAYANEEELKEIKKRFPENNKNPNLFILKKQESMNQYTGTTAQIFVDLWNLRQWYASDFLKALEEKIGER